MDLEQQQRIADYEKKLQSLIDQQTVMTQQFNASVQQLAQLNNKSNKPVYGIAAQYKSKLSVSKFKLVCYFKKDKKGNFYSIVDKEKGWNRKPIPSTDFIGGRVDHQTAFEKLIDYAMQNFENLDSALIIVNDYVDELEHTVLSIDTKNFAHSQQVHIKFKEFKGGIYFDYIDGKPLRTDKMKFYAD